MREDAVLELATLMRFVASQGVPSAEAAQSAVRRVLDHHGLATIDRALVTRLREAEAGNWDDVSDIRRHICDALLDADFVPTALEIQRGQGLARGMEIVDSDVARVVAGADDPHTTGGKAALSLRKDRDEARGLLGEWVTEYRANVGDDDKCNCLPCRSARHLGGGK